MPPLAALAQGAQALKGFTKGGGDMQEVPLRIGNFSAALWLGLAVIFDGVQFLVSFFHVIPYAGNAIAFVVTTFISLAAWILFSICFALFHRVNYFSGKKAALKLLAVFGSVVIEIIPLLNALPAITSGVLLIIVATRIEDTVGDEKSLTKVKDARERRMQEAQTAEAQRREAARVAVERRRMMQASMQGRQYAAPDERMVDEEVGSGDAAKEMAHAEQARERVEEASQPFVLEAREAESYGIQEERAKDFYTKTRELQSKIFAATVRGYRRDKDINRGSKENDVDGVRKKTTEEE